MRNLYVLAFMGCLLFAVACNSEEPQKNNDAQKELIEQEQSDGIANGGDVEEKQTLQQDDKEKQTGSEVADEQVNPDEVYGEKGRGINRDPNPDNLNMAFDVAEKKSHIEYIPLLSNDEKDAYFVQILVSANKLPKSHFEKKFSDAQRIYVAKVGANYKYAIAKLNSQQEAEDSLSKLKSAYNLKKVKVTKFLK